MTRPAKIIFPPAKIIFPPAKTKQQKMRTNNFPTCQNYFPTCPPKKISKNVTYRHTYSFLLYIYQMQNEPNINASISPRSDIIFKKWFECALISFRFFILKLMTTLSKENTSRTSWVSLISTFLKQIMRLISLLIKYSMMLVFLFLFRLFDF